MRKHVEATVSWVYCLERGCFSAFALRRPRQEYQRENSPAPRSFYLCIQSGFFYDFSVLLHPKRRHYFLRASRLLQLSFSLSCWNTSRSYRPPVTRIFREGTIRRIALIPGKALFKRKRTYLHPRMPSELDWNRNRSIMPANDQEFSPRSCQGQ